MRDDILEKGTGIELRTLSYIIFRNASEEDSGGPQAGESTRVVVRCRDELHVEIELTKCAVIPADIGTVGAGFVITGAPVLPSSGFGSRCGFSK